jgi:hypothetical protein
MAFVAAIEEYNGYGVSQTSHRFKIEHSQQLQLYGFKVASSNTPSLDWFYFGWEKMFNFDWKPGNRENDI